MPTSVPFSVEFFPPKTNNTLIQLEQDAATLSACSPEFFSVTFGAGGGVQDFTSKTVEALQAVSRVPVSPHISCITSTKEQLKHLLNQYERLRCQHLVVLRGDRPSGHGYVDSELSYASDLVRFIRKESRTRFTLSVAAYPECHPESSGLHEEVMSLKEKMKAGANNAITQYFYSADSYFFYRDYCEKQGVTLPIIPGIMPIVNGGNLARFSKRCGAELPKWLVNLLSRYPQQKDQQAVGFEVVHRLCEQLIAQQAPGLHFYSLNQLALTQRLIQSLSLGREAVVPNESLNVITEV